MKFARIIPAFASLSLLLAACERTPTSGDIAPPTVGRHDDNPPPPPPPPPPADTTGLGGGTKGGGD
ncbi:MAG TPA: hypothetical protein VF710_16570 [Longimicrobium sp.]